MNTQVLWWGKSYREDDWNLNLLTRTGRSMWNKWMRGVASECIQKSGCAYVQMSSTDAQGWGAYMPLCILHIAIWKIYFLPLVAAQFDKHNSYLTYTRIRQWFHFFLPFSYCCETRILYVLDLTSTAGKQDCIYLDSLHILPFFLKVAIRITLNRSDRGLYITIL